MLTDAHCHPYDLHPCFPAAEDQRQRMGVMCAASSTALEEFEFCERILQLGNTGMLLCFAVHPQYQGTDIKEQTAVLEMLAKQGRLAVVGETGFDLFNTKYKATEKMQEELFSIHLETALQYDLPVVVHVRRAMHRIFAHAAALKKCKTVIFHSWSGTESEGEALLRRGINAFFSFGTPILLNHREVMRCCTRFPADRLLTETDAPFQPLRGREFSCYADLAEIITAMESLRGETGMEGVIEDNFRAAFGC
ncbi:MAG: TatD family hydrolase [Treponema sp.]|nr:TatD family hydrolase [Treponema sp.]